MTRQKPTATAGRYTVTGPNVDLSYADLGPAVSRAVTAAERLPDAGTVYVRDLDGSVVARVENDGVTTLIHTRANSSKAAA